MRTKLIVAIIGLGMADLGLLMAVLAVIALPSVRDDVREAEVTNADIRYSGPEMEKAPVSFREAADSVAVSADLGTAAPTPSPVVRYVAARSMSRMADTQPNGDGLTHRPRPPDGLCLPPSTSDAPSATDRKVADAGMELETSSVKVEAPGGEPFGVGRIQIRNPKLGPTRHADQPRHVDDGQGRVRYVLPAGAIGEDARRGGWGLNHHSSTFEEGVAHGNADVVRSTGECRYLHSVAMCNLQEAHELALENRKKAVETYFALARINRDERARQRGPRATCEQLSRYAHQRAPERLTSQEFDPACGTLAWPGLLQGPQFAAERNAIDRLMTARSLRNDGSTSEAATNIQKLVEGLKIKLKQQIKTLSPMEYVAAQKFLAGVQYEAYPRRPEIASSARLAELAAK